jgi:hypothetical protein
MKDGDKRKMEIKIDAPRQRQENVYQIAVISGLHLRSKHYAVNDRPSPN